ncbi:hypothetical protein KUTeg_023014 [Tegillarca granosa]|uniref:Bacterial surface antigen (D15) domain-containing protein n=1 Tax=Tegillarca granosa TaxID=220873 RepID=A0ABQ9E0E3_TEGGR|nr:hypothetical protein KUTeg_023014 [Tegillarca granosa]
MLLREISDDQKGKIQEVIVKGIYKTKEDFLKKTFKHVFKAENFSEIKRAIEEATVRLNTLEIFKGSRPKFILDIYEGPGAQPDGYTLILNEKEKYFTGGTTAQIDRDNAYLKTYGKVPNVFGRGESLSAAFTLNPKYGFNREYGSKNLVFKKPIGADPNYMLNADLFHSNQEYTWSGYKELARGVVLGLSFPFMNGSHNIQWNGIWRDLRALSPATSFAVREESGHTLKSSIREYAGLGGNIEFLKHDMEFQISQKLPLETVIQLSLAGGLMKSLNPSRDISINDRFFTGGPTSLRGFNFQGVGPHMNGNALGADAYWLCGLHVYRPLPFNIGKSEIGRHFRTHFFVNAGNLVNIDMNKTAKENFQTLSESYRLSYGGGIVLMFGFAKLELNYVFPIRSMEGDRICPGLQFGVGIEFL